MVNITTHRTFELFFCLKYNCGLYAKCKQLFLQKNSSCRSTRPGASRPLPPLVLFDIFDPWQEKYGKVFSSLNEAEAVQSLKYLVWKNNVLNKAGNSQFCFLSDLTPCPFFGVRSDKTIFKIRQRSDSHNIKWSKEH